MQKDVCMAEHKRHTWLKVAFADGGEDAPGELRTGAAGRLVDLEEVRDFVLLKQRRQHQVHVYRCAGLLVLQGVLLLLLLLLKEQQLSLVVDRLADRL